MRAENSLVGSVQRGFDLVACGSAITRCDDGDEHMGLYGILMMVFRRAEWVEGYIGQSSPNAIRLRARNTSSYQ